MGMMTGHCFGWFPLLRDISIAISTNLLAGLYAGLVVARAARFGALKNEAKRLVQTIDWVPSDPRLESAIIKQIEQMNAQFSLISSELYFLKHLAAGDTINRLSADFGRISGTRRLGENFAEQYVGWQQTIRKMPPNWRAVLSLRPSV